MAETTKHTFINYGQSNPRPTQTQRQTVSAFIGRHFRNRSAPAQRAQPPPHNDDRRPLLLLPRPSTGADGRQVVRKWRLRRSIKEGGRYPPEDTGAETEIPETSGSRSNNANLLLRPVVECFVPAYPTEHRQKAFHILDFIVNHIVGHMTHWGKGPNPEMRCWVQMICSDMTLFDAVAAFSHGIRITTLEDKVTPSAAVLWHKARALKGLQAKISTETVDKVAVWTSNETILATFYLMEGAARFGYDSEFKTHCLGFFQMMQLRGQVASARLQDLYIIQAAGLVEGTEMASTLRNRITPNNHQSSNHELVAVTSSMRILNLRYPQPGLPPEEALQVMIDNLPVGFRDLAATGNLSMEFIILLREQLQQYDSVAETVEQQTKGIKKARLLANQSHNVVEELACLGVVAFLTRHTAQMKFFPETSFLHRVKMLGKQVGSFGQAGLLCHHELRVWAVLAAAEIATTAGATLKQHAHNMMTELLFEERWIGSWSDMERVVKRYLCNKKTLTAWKKCWMSYQNVSKF